MKVIVFISKSLNNMNVGSANQIEHARERKHFPDQHAVSAHSFAKVYLDWAVSKLLSFAEISLSGLSNKGVLLPFGRKQNG